MYGKHECLSIYCPKRSTCIACIIVWQRPEHRGFSVLTLSRTHWSLVSLVCLLALLTVHLKAMPDILLMLVQSLVCHVLQ